MKNNIANKEGFKPNFNYPKNRKSRSGKNFIWTKDPIGRFIKTSIGIWGDDQCGMSVEMERNFYAQGVGAKAIYHFVISRFIGFNFYYEEIRGAQLTEGIVGDRYHKQYYDNNAPQELRGRRSAEHYLFDPKLRSLVPAVNKRLKIGTPISLDEVIEIVNKVDEKLI